MSITRSLPMLPGIAPPSSDPRPADREDAYRPFDPGQEDAIVDALFDAYLLGMPLVVGFSGGKDSHLLLALVWKALGRVKARAPARLATPVIVMVGDTMTENPVIQMRTATSVASIRAAARRDGLPIYAEIATPAVGDLLLVRIIGHGYPAMTQNFRWCVERVKAGPSARAVDRIIGRDTPAIFVLGTRKGESAARKRNMEGRAGGRTVAGIPLQPNPARPGSFAYEPLADVTLGQGWCHLESRMLAPWGDKWLELAALYKESSDACPVQMPGTSRDTCGNSRFGCWCCTVVKNERSLRNLAAGAAPWMGKMVVFRDLLHETTQGEARYDARSIRGGETETINLTGKGTEQGGTLSPRGYTMTFRKRLLALLLDAEDDARRLGPVPDYRLIDDNALREIQRVWEQDWGDWEQSAVEIARPYRGEAWAYSPHPRLAPRRHIPGHPAALCRKALVQHRAHDVDLPPLLLWRFVDIAERFRDDPSYRGLVAANRRMAQLTACDWRSDGIIVADLLWERAIERTGEEDRHLQAAERQRLVARAVQPALVEMEQAAPPPTQADAMVAEIVEALARDPGTDVWGRIVRAPRHGTAPRKGARRVEDDGHGAVVWDVTRWFDRLTNRRDTFFCRDGSYGYVSEIYGDLQGAAKHWVAYPPARAYTGEGRPPSHAVLGKRAARYQALAYIDGRWRRAIYDRDELCWRYAAAIGDAHEEYATWHAEPLKTASHAALRLEGPLDDDRWLAAPGP